MKLSEYIKHKTDGIINIKDFVRLTGFPTRTLYYRYHTKNKMYLDKIDEYIELAMYAKIDEMVKQMENIAAKLEKTRKAREEREND